MEDRKTIVSKSQCLANTQKMNGLKCSWSLKNHPLVKLSTSLSRENGANSNSSLSINRSTNQPINQYYLTISRVVFYKFGKQRIQLFHSATCPDPRYVQPGTRNVFPIEVALFRLTRSPLEKSSNHPRSRSRSKARMNHRSDSDCELLKPLLSLVAIFEGFIMVLSWFYL